jgi:hypothetical protein
VVLAAAEEAWALSGALVASASSHAQAAKGREIFMRVGWWEGGRIFNPHERHWQRTQPLANYFFNGARGASLQKKTKRLVPSIVEDAEVERVI